CGTGGDGRSLDRPGDGQDRTGRVGDDHTAAGAMVILSREADPSRHLRLFLVCCASEAATSLEAFSVFFRAAGLM
ncbi:MAG TPA: hypothetical protein DDW89_01930, partial [Gammaproteobacteria bacterium]|nr:hypothetical protein [Gammaproteobacteria bacterium]